VDISIALLLLQDGITSGAVYALLALALVLVFSVTRVIFLPQGEFVAYGALTLAAIQVHQAPATTILLMAIGGLTFVAESVATLRNRELRKAAGRYIGVAAAKYLAFPIVLHFAVQALAPLELPLAAQIAIAMLIVVPMGPMLYRIAYQPLAEASTLVLLIASVGVHFALVGLGLVMFGAEGSRTIPFSDASFDVGVLQISGQSMWVIGTSGLLIVALYLYFERTLSGKALRATAVNGLGAKLVGIGTSQAGRLAFTLAAAIGTFCGVLIAPVTTVYYEFGFLMGLKGFVGAILGGLVSYPLAAAGALLVGVLESYSSFFASAFKEVIVFTMIIPVLLWRSLKSKHVEDEE
jgi:branched-chain amino acid transport system permease protein